MTASHEEFNADHYQEGGIKFDEANLARQRALTRQQKAAGDSRPSPNNNTIDGDFFKDPSSGGVKVHMTGKYKNAEFGNRVQLFPHQSGYIVGSVVTGAGSVATSATSLNTDKKGHKAGKRRTKDRSWRQ